MNYDNARRNSIYYTTTTKSQIESRSEITRHTNMKPHTRDHKIIQCWKNITVKLKMGAKKFRLNNQKIKVYKPQDAHLRSKVTPNLHIIHIHLHIYIYTKNTIGSEKYMYIHILY